MKPPTLTPLHIMMMLHYHTIAAPYAVHDEGHRTSLSVTNYRRDLFRWGLITPCKTDQKLAVIIDTDRLALMLRNPEAVRNDHGDYTSTHAGRDLVERLCQTAIRV